MARGWSVKLNTPARHTMLMAVLALASWTAAGDGVASGPIGPYNAEFLAGGIGIVRRLEAHSPLTQAGAAWTMSGWIRPAERQTGRVIVAALGDPGDGPPGGEASGAGAGKGEAGAAGDRGGDWRGLALVDGAPALVLDRSLTLRSATVLVPGQWRALAATYDGKTARLYVDGREDRSGTFATGPVAARLSLAPAAARDFATSPHFGGALAYFTVSTDAVSADTVEHSSAAAPTETLVLHQVGSGWPWQEHAWRGLQQPQDPWTLPQGRSPPRPAVATAAPPDSDELHAIGPALWSLDHWHMAAAPAVRGDGAAVSAVDYADHGWYTAVVPGTALSTFIARGVYPDSDYGLDNMAIPESLNRQDYWYRSVFIAPATAARDFALVFNGINYAAEVWLNGHRLGTIRGAFTRARFDVTAVILPGARNALAVRVSPPPHPGIPHEQSIAAGPGNNGGALAIDGPTFIAAEGWDWIPAIRDRNTGIWQSVELAAQGSLSMHDPHVVTLLPLPRTDVADITVTVPITNRETQPVDASLTLRFDGRTLVKALRVPPGDSEVKLQPAEFPQLHLNAPRLWWPNGYGAPNLYTMSIQLNAQGRQSDLSTVRFGIRQLTYELSLFDRGGRLRRVEVDPTQGSAAGERLVDVRHEAIKRTPAGWAQSLTAAGETSRAVHAVHTESLSPYLVIRVNGVPIAARGGSWGTDDSRKRISRERLEPFFKLHREEHLNIIRNWLGQNTEPVFYDLADEYGMLVLNDFWISTQDFQVEPQDPQLFLANARDVISRYRNHPSIAVWFGRNEGVPQPIINEGLNDLILDLDGTRLYTGSSNSVNLQGSGPYDYQPPEKYFTGLARGFSVEVGTPSLATLEALRASIPAADLWPLSDTYAYHDWHFGGNGDVASFMAALAEQHGAATGVEDFERKAQMMNYVSYRAIFEGFQAHLWTENSGRLLWMSHPAWPSNTWQTYSSDYDTGAAYYAVKKACEPIHAQLNLPDFTLAVVNTTRRDAPHLLLRTQVFSLRGRVLESREERIDAGANSVVTSRTALGLQTLLAREELLLVKLTLTDPHGAVLSGNLYWQGRTPASERKLDQLAAQVIRVQATARTTTSGTRVEVELDNAGTAPALATKMTVLKPDGARALPVYYDDNYITLLAGEKRHVSIECPADTPCSRIAIRGWNVVAAEYPIGAVTH